MIIRHAALLASVLSVSFAAHAQDLPKEFPAGATPVADDALKARLSGKFFDVPTAKEGAMQVELKENGYANFTWSARQYNDSGKWSVEGDRYCLALNKQRGGPPACSEVREKDGLLYIRRSSNGEIVPMNPR